MLLLELEHVSKSYRCASSADRVLQDVSLWIERGEVVAVWGGRRSGRSTLLRVAAGVEKPDQGVVRFLGSDLHGPGSGAFERGLVFCHRSFPAAHGDTVLDQLLVGQEAAGVPRSTATRRTKEVLSKVGLDAFDSAFVRDLGAGDLDRVMIARALIRDPRLILVDEPTLGTTVCERDSLLSLMRSVADGGAAVLATTGETPSLTSADRALTISDGKLRGAIMPRTGTVVPLREIQPAA